MKDGFSSSNIDKADCHTVLVSWSGPGWLHFPGCGGERAAPPPTHTHTLFWGYCTEISLTSPSLKFCFSVNILWQAPSRGPLIAIRVFYVTDVGHATEHRELGCPTPSVQYTAWHRREGGNMARRCHVGGDRHHNMTTLCPCNVRGDKHHNMTMLARPCNVRGDRYHMTTPTSLCNVV